PELRDRPHRDAVAGQLARRQGRRGGGDDRRVARRRQRRGGRAAPARRHVPRHAADAHEGVGRDPGGAVMIPPEFDYVAPASLDEALQALQQGGEDAKVLAGGHSLIPLMKLRLAFPTLLVDLRKLDGLRGAEPSNGGWKIGAMTRHADLQNRPELGLAAVAARSIADQQVRNRGTIGGSLA